MKLRFPWNHTTIVAATLLSMAANAAEPYITTPNDQQCGLPDVVTPSDSLSTYYGSNECGVIFIPPPERLSVDVVAEFSNVRKEECDVILQIEDAIGFINVEKSKINMKRVTREISEEEFQERSKIIDDSVARLNKDLDIPYRTFGSEIALSIRQKWNEQVELYKEHNGDYKVFPLHTVAGLIVFHEKRTKEEIEYVGVFENSLREPWINYSVSGLKPLETDSPLLDGNALPIFYPIAREARAGLDTIEFGGGAVTANVTLNQRGACKFKNTSLGNAAAPLQLTANYLFALKSSGTYTVTVNSDHLVQILDSLRKSRTGTAHASAVANDLFTANSSQTVHVVLDDNLRKSFAGDSNSESAVSQTVFLDIANQFLLAATEGDGRPPPRQVELPDLEQTKGFRVLEKIRNVCRRTSYLFGLVGSKKCYDQVYNVKHLQDTSQYQQAVHRIRSKLDRKISTRRNEYILVPAQASL